MTDKAYPEQSPALQDTYHGDDASLVSSIKSLLNLDAAGVLVPHGVGGHARALLSAAAVRLASRPAAGSGISDEQIDAYLTEQRRTVEEADRFGRPNVGGLHTNTVREACRNGLRAALLAMAPATTQPANLSKPCKHWLAQAEEARVVAAAQCDGGSCGIGGYCDQCPTQPSAQEQAAREATGGAKS